MQDLDRLGRLLALLKEHGVRRYRCGDLEIDIGASVNVMPISDVPQADTTESIERLLGLTE